MKGIRAIVGRAMLALAVGFGAAQAAEDPAKLRDEAFQAAQWAITTSAGQALAQMSARFAAGEGDLATIVRDRQDLVELWQRKDEAFLDALGRSDEGAKARTDALRAEMDDIEARIAAIDADLAARFPQYQELTNPKPLAVADVQKLLKPGEAVVLFLVNAEDSYVFAVSPDAAAWNRVEMGSAAIAEKVARLRATLDPGGALRAAESAFGEALAEGGTPFDRTTAYELWRAFLEPLGAPVTEARHLMVVADGPFTSLPLSVLVTRPPEGDDADPEALRTTGWLIETTALTTLPAVSSLRALRAFERTKAGTREPFRGFGAPKLVGRAGLEGAEEAEVTQVASRNASAFFRGRYADVDAVRSLEPLPATADELARLAAALKADPAAVALGDAATETAVKSAGLDAADVLAFATHGLLTGELKGLSEPALVFTPPKEATDTDDGLLTASEAAQLKLSADWVILSACNTASGDGTPGADGLSGLARAFIYAGARAILVSHWPVRDDAAAELTTGTFSEIAAEPGIGRAEALRRSMLKLMQADWDPSLAHPSAWAPFVVVGEGGAG